MNLSVLLLAAILAGAIEVFLLVRVARVIQAYFKLRGQRLVTCPETNRPAAVELDAKRGAPEAFLGEPRLRLSTCSRWPERSGCGQECLGQIESAPEDCLVRRIVMKWYEGKVCAFCQRPITEAGQRWLGHPPALVSSGNAPIAWEDLPPDKLPDAFSAQFPVCWSCYVTETFRRDFPELVTDRPPDRLRIML
jgi:hypothetical protein